MARGGAGREVYPPWGGEAGERPLPRGPIVERGTLAPGAACPPSPILDEGSRPRAGPSPTQTAGASSSSPFRMAVLGSRLYFRANDGVVGSELWSTDGTASGTSLVADIRTGSASSSPKNFVAVGSQLFFLASDGTHGVEL